MTCLILRALILKRDERNYLLEEGLLIWQVDNINAALYSGVDNLYTNSTDNTAKGLHCLMSASSLWNILEDWVKITVINKH